MLIGSSGMALTAHVLQSTVIPKLTGLRLVLNFEMRGPVPARLCTPMGSTAPRSAPEVVCY